MGVEYKISNKLGELETYFDYFVLGCAVKCAYFCNAAMRQRYAVAIVTNK